MTIMPSQINDVLKIYTKISRVSPVKGDASTPDVHDTEDVVSISTEAKRKQVLEQTRQEVIKKIKETAI